MKIIEGAYFVIGWFYYNILIKTYGETLIQSHTKYQSECELEQNGDYGDYPRSKKQLIDISYSLEKSNVHEVGDLLALNYELQDKIIWHHSDVPSDIWVFGTDSLLGKFQFKYFIIFC